MVFESKYTAYIVKCKNDGGISSAMFESRTYGIQSASVYIQCSLSSGKELGNGIFGLAEKGFD